MADKILPLKAAVEVRIRTHCPGCGIDYQITSILEPICFETPAHMVDLIRHSMFEIQQAIPKCDRCRKQTKQIDVRKYYE